MKILIFLDLAIDSDDDLCQKGKDDFFPSSDLEDMSCLTQVSRAQVPASVPSQCGSLFVDFDQQEGKNSTPKKMKCQPQPKHHRDKKGIF